MDDYIAILHSKTKLHLLYNFMKQVENLLKTNCGKISKELLKNSEESAVLINIEFILKDLNAICDLKNNLCGKYYIEEFRNQVDDAYYQLKSAIRILKASVNKLSLNYISETVRELVAVDIKFILESVVTFLLTVQNIDEKILENICSDLSSTLFSLKTHFGTPHYSRKYKELLLCIQEFISVVQKQLEDMINNERKYKLIVALTEFKRLFILLHEVQFMTYSNLTQLKKLSIWNYIIAEMNFYIEKVIQFNKNENLIEDYKDMGYFVNKIDELLCQLSSKVCLKIQNGKLEQLLEEILQHSMAVSHFIISKENSMKDLCQKVLQQYNICMNVEKKLENNNNDQKLKQALILESEVLLDDIDCLERQLNIEILKLIGNKFPRLQTLFKSNMDFIFNLKNKETTAFNLDLLFKDFYEQADLLYQICRFAISCSTDFFTVYRILIIVDRLENFEPEIIPVVKAFYQDQSRENLYQLKFIKKEWNYFINELIYNIIKIADATAFLRILRIQIEKECSKFLDCESVFADIKYVSASLKFFVCIISFNYDSLTSSEDNKTLY
ncbi:uncharacterized protein [Centruroides vittatus]|uniref:uncharacterized protein n=1 Tax=Centruroides vittatus TaxID=120091 RepID=UPI00350FD6AA